MRALTNQPHGSDLLRQEIARRLSIVMARRGMTRDDVARQTGLTVEHVQSLLLGRGELTQEICQRLLNWFKGQKTSGKFVPSTVIKPGPNWRTVSIKLPPAMMSRLGALKSKLYLDVPEIVHLALARFLNDSTGLIILDRAMRELQATRLAQQLQEMPEITEILKADLDLAVELGCRIESRKEAAEVDAPLPSEQLRREFESLNRTEEESIEEDA